MNRRTIQCQIRLRQYCIVIGLIALSVFSLMPFSGHSQQLSRTVRIRNTSVEIPANTDAWFANTQSGREQVLVHLIKYPDADTRQILLSRGVVIQDFIDENVYTAIIDYNVTLNYNFKAYIYGVATVKPSWKSDTDINITKSNPKDRYKLIVSFYDVMPVGNIVQLLNELNAVNIVSPINELGSYIIEIPVANVNMLAGNYAVRAISRYTDNELLNYASKAASKANTASVLPVFGGPGLTGKGVVVGIGDNVGADGHIDLKDRTINFNPASYTNHGVHISGIAGGAGIMDLQGEGVATGSTMINHVFSKIWENTPVFYPQYNMTLTNNSYAAVIRDCNYSGTYNVYSETIDNLSLQYNKVFHVFASGNDGDLNCSPYPAGFGTVVGGYQPAKNNVVVTSTDKNYVNAFDGSRGPTKDGRLKPEITAVGVAVRSTTKNDEYLTAGGTSMATPGVTGGLALLAERYKELNSNADPRSDLLKTILLNGTTDIGNPGPDYRYGFGFMNIYRSLQMLNNHWYFTGSVLHAGQQSHTITVPVNTAQLKVMLYWHDVAANPMSAKQLVNDMDLEVNEVAGTVVHKPLVLDNTPSKVLDNAVEGIDRLNNCEQVIINNPVAGNYNLTIKGFNLPSGTREYVLAYDYIPVGVRLTFPATGSQIKAGDSVYVYWDASDDNNAFTLSYTTDGFSWITIDNNIAPDRRYYRWEVPSFLSSGTCMMRIERNNIAQQFTSGLFVVNPIPEPYLDPVQCPGYIRIQWEPVINATQFEVLQKRGPYMQVIDTTAAFSYTFSGLSLDSTYYVAVRPIIDGMSGYRSIALKRKPDNGSCAGNISDGDLVLHKLVNPSSGRKLTSTALSSTTPLSIAIKNLDDVTVNSYKISYNINNTGWQQQSFTIPIPAGGIGTVQLTTADFSAVGTYTIKLAVDNISMTDPVKKNDSMVKYFRQVDNPPINLASIVADDFENWPVMQTIQDSFAVSPDSRWDYINSNDTCRLRTFVIQPVCITGSRSVSLDAVYNFKQNNVNELRSTLNLSNYNKATDEIRLEFDYLLHGQPRNEESNFVQIRGKDTDNWRYLYEFMSDAGGTGKVINSGSLSLTDIMRDSNMAFSTSTQINFVQNDISLISERNHGNGITLDNVKLYTVFNDIQLLGVISPQNIECGLTGEQPLVIKVRNGVTQTLSDISLYYRLDNGIIVKEILPSINGKQTIEYTFTKKLDLAVKGKHVLNVWLAANGDSYLKNDSVNNYIFYNQPLITGYPYKENFEAGSGNWYTEGINNSWAWGKPASPKINKAYSGEYVWKTSLTGNYNQSELSYLYSPCFDLSSLINPAIRFRNAMDIENCGQVLCDGAFIEYSTDRQTWERLGKGGEGIGWYNDTTYTQWSEENHTDWHEAYLPLPKGLNNITFRYLFFSDLGAEKEGMAIDDVEIFEDLTLLQQSNLLRISPNPTKDGKITIEWTAKAGDEFQLSIVNTLGKQVYAASAQPTVGYNKAIFETPYFSSGVYIVNIRIGERKYSRKIVYL